MYTNKGVPEFIQKCVIVTRPTKRSVQIQLIDLIISSIDLRYYYTNNTRMHR